MSGGHSFSLDQVGACANCEALSVVVLTSKTTLVPAELFDAERAAYYLAEVGLAPRYGECAVCSEPCNDMVAVMAISKECHAALQGVTPALTFITPLLGGNVVEQGSMLHLEDNLLYVRVYGNGLRFAEVVECKSDADILYYLTKIDEVYSIYNMSARATGDTTRMQRVTKRLFKELICE